MLETHTLFYRKKHRMIAPDGDVTYIESSTPELDDIVRLEDKYRENDNIQLF